MPRPKHTSTCITLCAASSDGLSSSSARFPIHRTSWPFFHCWARGHAPSFARLQTMLDKEAPLVPASAWPAEREQSTHVWSAETLILPLTLHSEPSPASFRLPGPFHNHCVPANPPTCCHDEQPLPHLIQRRGAVKECGCISPQPVGLAPCI